MVEDYEMALAHRNRTENFMLAFEWKNTSSQEKYVIF